MMRCTALQGTPSQFVTVGSKCLDAFSFLARELITTVAVESPGFSHEALSPEILDKVPVLFPKLAHLLVVGLFDWPHVLRVAQMAKGTLRSLSIACKPGDYKITADSFEGLNLKLFNMSKSGVTIVPAALASLEALETLSLSNNDIASLPSSVFSKLTLLRRLYLGNNNITAVPSGMFSSMPSLEIVGLEGNFIESISAVMLSGLTSLQQLDFRDNRITEVHEGAFSSLSSLLLLSLAYNRITQLSPNLFANNPLLNELSFSNNELKELPAGLFLNNRLMALLSFRDNRLTALPPGLFRPLIGLTYLAFGHNAISELETSALHGLSELRALFMEGNRLSSMPEDMFRDLTQVQALRIDNNGLTGNITRTMQPLKSLYSLNTSENPELDDVGRPWETNEMSLLDVSHTRIWLNWITCHPGLTLGIRNMPIASRSGLSDIMLACLTVVRVMDVSSNEILSNVTFFQEVLSSVTLALPISEDDNDGNHNVAALQSLNSAAQCVLKNSAAVRAIPESFRRNSSAQGVFFPALVFECYCSAGYHDKGDGLCVVIPPFWSKSRIAVLTIGCICAVVLFLLYLAVPRYRKRQRQFHENIELHKGLLEESQGEVLALKRAWEISPDEINLEARIDQNSEGSFGEVWRGRWGEYDVAVKVLRLELVEFDEETVNEFEREVEFMQTTRHPNIVRFFGAGRLHNGVPFLVEELLNFGSLRVCIRGHSIKGWPQKLQIAQGIARGMAHIHSLGHIHRDLKSGNVLVTRNLTAKVADFGSIGSILRGNIPGHPNSAQATVASGRRRSVVAPPKMADMTSFVGTPLYMSAEMLRQQPYGSPTDVWSFGVLLWELSAEERPDIIKAYGHPNGTHIIATLLKLLDNDSRLPLDDEWPAELRNIISQCWSTDPHSRPTFAELGTRLNAVEA